MGRPDTTTSRRGEMGLFATAAVPSSRPQKITFAEMRDMGGHNPRGA